MIELFKMSEEENTRTVGNANPVCSSGRSTGTPGTRHGKIYKESLRFSKPLLLGTKNIGGVGNYAKLLADFLKKKGISSKILVSDYLENKNKNNSQFGKNKDLLFLLNKNSSKKIILHFSGYGYASRGLCFRLVESLNQWKKITN